MESSFLSTLSTVRRNWFGTPVPSFQLRRPSSRWSRSAGGRKRRTLRVTEVIRESPSTSTFVLEPLDRTPLEYRPGQHLTLFVDVGGETLRRCYSFSTAPGNGSRPAITVKHVPDGRVSGYLATALEGGATLRAAEPSGTFTVSPDPEASRSYVMIAGGVGITPLISMTEALLHGEPKSSIRLLFGNRSEEEILFRRRLADLARRYPVSFSLTLALDAAPADWSGERGPLTGERVLALLGRADPEAHYLVCGPGPMMDSVTAALAAAGVPADHIRLERFEYATPAARAGRPTESFRVRFATSGKELRSVPGEPILATALGAGLDLEYSCQMGGCGACKLSTSSGAFVMDEPNCLTPSELEQGTILACCAYPTADAVVEDR